jgi:hypothetical protein
MPGGGLGARGPRSSVLQWPFGIRAARPGPAAGWFFQWLARLGSFLVASDRDGANEWNAGGSKCLELTMPDWNPSPARRAVPTFRV